MARRVQHFIACDQCDAVEEVKLSSHFPPGWINVEFCVYFTQKDPLEYNHHPKNKLNGRQTRTFCDADCLYTFIHNVHEHALGRIEAQREKEERR